MNKICKKLFFISLIFFISVKVFAVNGEVKMTLVVQPYEKTKTQILFNGESIKFNIIYTDKSLSILEFVCNINQTAKTLEVRHPKFETKTFELTTNKTSVKLFAILDKPNSTLSFQNLYTTNGTPKALDL